MATLSTLDKFPWSTNSYQVKINQIQIQTWMSACGKTPDPGLELV